MINRENYEIYLVDYIDGNLSEDEMEMVRSFLSENPDIQEEFEMISGMKLNPEDVEFDNKDSLKIVPDLPQVNLTNFHDFLSKDIDGELTNKDRTALNRFAENNESIQPYIKANKHVVLEPSNETFSSKDDLYQFTSGRSFAEIAIAFSEGTADVNDSREFKSLINSSAHAMALYNDVTGVTLEAPTILFEDKDSLKKGGRVIPLWVNRASAIAAVLVLGFLAVNYWSGGEDVNRNYSIRKAGAGNIAIQEDPIELPDYRVFETVSSIEENSSEPLVDTTFEYVLPQEQLQNISQPHKPEQYVAQDSAVKDSMNLIDPIDDNIAHQFPIDSIVPKDSLPNGKHIPDVNKVIPDPEVILASSTNTSTNTTSDLAELAFDGIEKVLDTSADIVQLESNDRKRTLVNIGKFGYYRSKKK